MNINEKANILIYSPTPSHPQNAGNRTRIFNLARHIQRKGYRVHFVFYAQEWVNDEAIAAMEKTWDSFTLIPKEIEYAQSGDDHYLIDDWYQDNIGPIVARKCIEFDVDIILVNYIFQSKLLEYIPKKVLKIIDTHDRFSDRHTMLQANGLTPDFFYTIDTEEAKAFDRADIILAIQKNEAEFFRTITGKKVVVVSHIEETEFLTREYNSLKKIGFIGSGNSVNAKSINLFLEEFCKLIDEKKLDIEIVLAGSICDKITMSHTHIKKQGFVKELNSFYKTVDLIINPLVLGTGLKIKSIEAIAKGMPIVSTDVGFEGIKTNSDFHVCKNISEMIKKIVYLYSNPQYLNDLALLSQEIFKTYVENVNEEVNNVLIPKKTSKTLIVTDIYFWKADIGNRQRILRLIQYLVKHIHLRILFIGQMSSEDRKLISQYNLLAYIDLIQDVHVPKDIPRNNQFKPNSTLKNFYNHENKNKFDYYLNLNHFDNIIIEYIRLDYLINSLHSKYTTIIDTHDLMSLRTEAYAKNNDKFFIEITREEEIKILAKYNYVLAIQQNEYTTIKNYIPDKVLLAQHAVELLSKRVTNKECKNFIFISGPANVKFIKWFIDEVWSFFATKTNLKLHIHGSVCQQLSEYSNHKGVILHGYANNLQKIYEEADVVINPILYGGGLKIKNVEALANGLPLITTTEGANGLEDGINQSFLLANTTDEWINSIIALMISIELRKELSNKAIIYANERFSDDACYSELVSVLKYDKNKERSH